ncbi:hypothetical protein K1719_022351 [Acacia pycnantha]|nr:hypothetical protein K1719_022351 [Acacia pycnantha]
MGFNSVYKCLQEIFPQVDARILRAVAIEHAKDVDLAAGIVLNEVIPLMSKRSTPLVTPPHDKGPETVANVEVGRESDSRLRHEQFVETVAAENVETASYSIWPHKRLILKGTEVPNTFKLCNSFIDGSCVFNLYELLKDTPTHVFASIWFEWRKINFYPTHYSELIRLATLYKPLCLYMLQNKLLE